MNTMNATTTHRLHAPSRLLLVNDALEAHAVHCDHDGHHLGTTSGPTTGEGYLVTVASAACALAAEAGLHTGPDESIWHSTGPAAEQGHWSGACSGPGCPVAVMLDTPCAHEYGVSPEGRCYDCDKRVGWGRLVLIDAGLVQS